MPSRTYTSFLLIAIVAIVIVEVEVSMPSRAYTSFLPLTACLRQSVYYENRCQCPLGLIPHFYGTPSKT